MSELKPCPFCGDIYIIVRNNSAGYYIGCNTINCIMCNTFVRRYRTKKDAVESWNKRAGEQE